MSGLIAAAAIVARLASPLPPATGIAELRAAPPVVVGVYRVTLAADAGVLACSPVIRSGFHALDTRICDELRHAGYDAAKDATGAPSAGVLDIPIQWTAADGLLTSIVAQTVDLTVSAMPPGVRPHAIAQLALTVDAEGAVQACGVARSSGSPALDAAGCASAPKAAGVQPVRDRDGRPVASIQSLGVGFDAYARTVFHAAGRYSNLGDAGPFFPERAARLGIGGYAVLACQAGAAGALQACTVAEEFPGGQQFGLAALRCAQTGWMKAAPGVTGPVRVRLDFPAPPVR